jgi:hypothetical protein
MLYNHCQMLDCLETKNQYTNKYSDISFNENLMTRMLRLVQFISTETIEIM